MHDIRSVLRMIVEKMEDELTRKLFTKSQIAPRYGVVQRTVDYWMKDGVIPYLKIGKKLVRFDPVECDRALERFKVASK
jgi:hypothetical protein